jgi:creatinine amidohydrolase
VIELAECTYVEAGKLARSPRSIVLLPLGAIEQHGPHLPLLVDWTGAEELARLLGVHLTRAGFVPIRAPALPYGASTLAASWAGTVSLTIPLVRRLVVEIIGQLAGHGFQRFVITNYQADPDHLRAIALARQDLARRRIRVFVAGFDRERRLPSPMINPSVLDLLRSRRARLEWHAGELETAMMLAVAPRMVKRKIARRLRPAWVDFAAALTKGIRSFEEMAPGGSGYFGSPAAARADTGRKAMRLRARLMAAELIPALRDLAVGARRARRTVRPARRSAGPSR